MATVIKMINPNTKIAKDGLYGFSWTSFFFSGIPAITRGDIGLGLGVLVATIIFTLFSFGLLYFVVNIIFAFVYNKNYTQRLIERGFVFAEDGANADRARQSLGMVS
ncbi:hypothetical protein LRP52_47450 [Photobacterium sp. ZSDE20]|uniref:HrgC protein n=1 Tax=Photobacterium pectinilyticum TaxID=2906793 RepID=A0ABT1NBV1_9GAMM|nr:hypothetical protein [Photobacterium sp. ZSDE20]MCQ1061289.1 hypothetical protein [Photobacterium sp. ZSDE20]MDD1829790.1 hypothetical protein [Photobacterium sp. ZSDE20]